MMSKWQTVRLGDVCEGTVTNIAQKDLADNDGDYPIYGASGLIKYVDFYKQEKPYVAVVKDGAGVGRVSRMPAKSSVIGTMQCILPSENIETSYLYYAMTRMKLASFYSGATIPQKQPKKKRLWMNDGSCIRLRAEYKNHVWSYDFIEDRTADGKKVRILNVIDESSRECLSSVPRRSWKGNAVIEVLADLIFKHGAPEYLRSDNGSEFTNKQIRKWLEKVGVITAFIEPGSPWENGYVESFNSRMRYGFLNGEIFGNMYELKALLDMWVRFYNEIRPHSALGGKPPAPRVIIPLAS